MRVNMIVNAFRQIGEEFCFPFAKWETVSPMAQLAIGSASLGHTYGKTTPTSSVPATVKSFHKTNQLERSSVSFAIFCVDDTSGKHMA